MVTFNDSVGERVINILPDNVNPFAANRGKKGRGGLLSHYVNMANQAPK